MRLHPTERAARNLNRLHANWFRLLASAGADHRHLDAALALLEGLESGLRPA